MAAHNATNYVLMIAEMRRYPQMSYKSDIVVLSGINIYILHNIAREQTESKMMKLSRYLISF